jgi:hypothetical protein
VELIGGIRSARPSLSNLPRINQGRQVEADSIHLQFDSIVVLNHGANDSILNFAVMQVHADFVADLELPVVWLLRGWHDKHTYVQHYATLCPVARKTKQTKTSFCIEPERLAKLKNTQKPPLTGVAMEGNVRPQNLGRQGGNVKRSILFAAVALFMLPGLARSAPITGVVIQSCKLGNHGIWVAEIRNASDKNVVFVSMSPIATSFALTNGSTRRDDPVSTTHREGGVRCNHFQLSCLLTTLAR